MDLNLKKLLSLYGSCKLTGSGELNLNCPFCIKRKGREDTGYHLYANPNKFLHNIRGWYYCQRCGAVGPLYRLLKGQEPAKDLTKWDAFVKYLKNPEQAKSKDKPVKLPEDFIPMVKGTEAHKYLRARGLSDEAISFYDIGFGTKHLKEVPRGERYRFAGSGRIVFPDYDVEGNLVYWVARTYVNHKVKYKNPQSDSRNKVYNLSRASEFDDVIITEGVMSAIAAGKNGVATYGKNVTSFQISMIVSVGFQRFYVALDGDALHPDPFSKSKPEAFQVADHLVKRGCETYLVVLPREHDPDSVGNFQHYLSSAKRYDLSVAAKLRM